MSRIDQYIGLTRDAETYVSGLERVGDGQLEGAFGNTFQMGIWLSLDGRITEIVQATPWASGPMFYTCLRLEFNGGGWCRIFCWVLNPTLKDTYHDYARGHYWC